MVLADIARVLNHYGKPLLLAGMILGIIPGIIACTVSSKDFNQNPSPLPGPIKIITLTTEETAADVQVSITADRPFSYYISNHENPFRLQIDFDTANFVDLPPELTVNKGLVEDIRVIPGGGLKQGGRIEIVLKEKVDYVINKKANRLIVSVPKGLEKASLTVVKGTGETLPQELQQPRIPGLSPPKERDYLIGGKDILDITVYDEPDLTKTLRVSSRGAISFPMIGTVRIEGLTPSEVEQKLEELLAQGYLKNPQVSVLVREYHSKEVFVVGLVKNPGVYPLTGPTTVLEMISRAGGLVSDVTGREEFGRAGKELILLRHEPKERKGPELNDIKYIRIDLDGLLNKGDMSLNLPLRAQDTLYIPQAESVYVFGEVKRPGAYELTRKDTTLVETITMAGGFTDIAAPNRVKVVRVEDGQEKTLNVNVNEITKRGEKSKDIPLKDGDVIVVPESFF